jgi:hypothetical protein
MQPIADGANGDIKSAGHIRVLGSGAELSKCMASHVCAMKVHVITMRDEVHSWGHGA